MWRIGDKRPIQKSSYGTLGDQSSPGEPPSKRIKITTSGRNQSITSRQRSWGFRGRIQTAWNSLVGGIRRLFHWSRPQHQLLPPATAIQDTTNMEYLRPDAVVPSQQLPSPIFASTPSQSLTPVPSTNMPDVSSVGAPLPDVVNHKCGDSHVSSASGLPNNHTLPESRSDEQLHSIIDEKQATQRTVQRREYSNKQFSKQEAQKTLQERGESEEGQPLREAGRLGGGQPIRERAKVKVDQSSLKEVNHRFDGRDRMLRGEKHLESYRERDLQKLSFPRTSTNGMTTVGSSYSTVMSQHSTRAAQTTCKPLYSPPATQSTRDRPSLFTPVLNPEVIGPSLSHPPHSSRSIRTTDTSISSFGGPSSVFECSVSTSAATEIRKSPTTISPILQSPWQPTPPARRREGGRESAMFHDEEGERGERIRSPNTQRLSQASDRNAQQVRDVMNLLERIKLEQIHGVEDRKTMAELIEKKIHLYQSERMVIEDARVSRLRQQLASTTVDDQREREKTHIETLATLSDNQATKVHMAVGGGPSSECLSQKFNIRVTRADIATLVGLQWLNDEVINFYFNMIKERSLEKGSNRRVHVFNTFFYSKLSKAGYSGVRRWTKKVDIFEFDMVLIPVHMGMHWCLAAVDFDTKCVSYYDSLHGNNTACLQRLRDYLKDESKDKKGVDFDLSSWTTSSPKDIPHQMNGSDCGVFTCMYARFLSVASPFQFSQEDMPNIRKHMIAEILEQNLF